MNRLLLSLFLILGYIDSFAQQGKVRIDSNNVVTNSFWDNWYGQVGMDMVFQNPFGRSINGRGIKALR
jgi:hypothetical protein